MLRAISLALLACLHAAAAAAEPAVAASARVAEVSLTAGKPAIRDLRFALGDRPEQAITAIAEDALRVREAFSAVGADAADWELRLEVRAARQEVQDLSAVVGVGRSDRSVLADGTEPRSRMDLRIEVAHAWTRAGAAAHAGSVVKEQSFRVAGPPRRDDLRTGWDEVIRAAVQDAFAQAYDQGVFGEAR